MLVAKNAPPGVSATKGATSRRRSQPPTEDAEQFASGACGPRHSGRVPSSGQSCNSTAEAAALYVLVSIRRNLSQMEGTVVGFSSTLHGLVAGGSSPPLSCITATMPPNTAMPATTHNASCRRISFYGYRGLSCIRLSPKMRQPQERLREVAGYARRDLHANAGAILARSTARSRLGVGRPLFKSERCSCVTARS